ncbi:cell division protein FtsA [Alistipes sp. Z76]|nr:cell division protein FtsA [Alistipes sp. Z76]NCE68839.1 cell division protein FtsA [Muribaculaceae bacterium M3]
MAVDNKSYIVAVDVGSSEVVVAVGSPNEGGVLEILTVVSEPTDGVSAGLVDNSKSVGQALRRARERAEQEARIAITDAYVGISGKFVRCARYTDHVFVEDVENCISQRDVNALMERMRNVKAADGEVIMDLFPLSYKGDAGTEMRNPVGCYSKQLSSTYNFILCEHMAKDRLRRVFLDAGIKIRGMFANAAVMADSVVSTDDKEEGVAVVDIGGGVTDVAVYYGGALRYIASIPIGGSAVNADIRAYGIPEKQVEKLKKRYGTAVADLTPDDIIQVRNSSRSLKSILRLNLAAVIEARMTDIAEYVWNEIRDAGFGKKLSAGIVLTGGGAGLKNIDELFRRVTGQEVRVACAEMGVATESLEKVSSPASTVAVSLLLRGAQTGACPVGVLHVEQPRAIEEQPKAAEEPATVNDRYGTAATREAAKGPAVADAPKPKPERAEESEPSKPSNSDDFEDEADDDIATGSGWFSNIFGKVREAFDDAFKKPDDDGDGEW